MRIDIMTLFPEAVAASLKISILGRAEKKGILDIRCVQIRDYTENRQQQVDDYPYGGGWGCVMMAQPLKACLDHVLSDEECFTGESHWEGLLEYPQYTRPETWEGRTVPEVLRGGNDAEIRRWRRKRMLERTMEKRPDLWEKRSLSEEDEALLAELMKERSRKKLTEPIECRAVTEADIPEVELLFRQSSNYLKKHRVDQWQDGYPNADTVRGDMARGEGYVMTYGGRTAGYFCLSARPEKAYDTLTDGKWRSDGPYTVIHRSCVGAEYRGTGMSDRLILAAEELTRGMGIGSVRADTHRRNGAMKKLLSRCGYRFRGNVLYGVGEGHDPRRQAFEKILK